MIIAKLFQDEKHKPFHWTGGEPAALLVHGFPGTPAELRPLGTSLHRAGWTVHGLLLPGLGPEIDTLFERHADDWLNAVRRALLNLRQGHDPVLLIGYSMGAALSIQVAGHCRPDGLILLAPFWQVFPWWQKALGMLLKPFFRRVRPFSQVDFSDPQTRYKMSNLFSNIDLEEPHVQQTLRQLTVPARLFEQLYQVGSAAYRLAPATTASTLIIQGRRDEVVTPDKTRQLLQRLATAVHYVEVDAGHDLVDPDRPAWTQVEDAIHAFAEKLRLQSADAPK